MENFKNKSFFWAFIVLWGGLILWNLFTPAQEFSESENRYLKVFPKFSTRTLLNGKFMEDVNVYLNDQFAGRPYWVSAQSLIEYGTGKREINGVYIGGDGMLLGDIAAPDMDVTAKNIAGINAFAEKYGIPTYAALIPSSTEIAKENLPKFAAGWDEKGYIDNVYSALAPEVKTVDVYSALDMYREFNLNISNYYRTDHHWTTFGARAAYFSAIAPSMGLPERSQPVTTLDVDFIGTYHSKTGFPLARADKIEVVSAEDSQVISVEVFDGAETTVRDSYFVDEFLDKKDKYSYFGGQVQPRLTVKTTAETGRKLIIFKDSYAHCLVPMLFGDFSEIRLVDLRFVNPMTIDEQLQIENYDEALFIYSTDVFSHQNGAGLLASVASRHTQ